MPWKSRLLAAVQFKSGKIAHELLRAGDTNPDGPFPQLITPLQIAIENDSLSIVKDLIRHGANVNIQDQYGDSSVHLSCSGDISLDIFLEILNANGDIRLQNICKWTPLHSAAEDACFEKIECLIKRPNAPINARDEDGNTALHLLLMSEFELEDISRLGLLHCHFVESGYDVNSQNEYGETIFHYASQHIYADMLLDVLLRHSPDVDLTVQDYEGNGFLHSYILNKKSFDFGENEKSFLTKFFNGMILQVDSHIIRAALEQQNIFGKSFFTLFLTQMYLDMNALKVMMGLINEPNQTDKLGMTPLINLMSSGSIETDKLRAVALLHNNGANINSRDIFGRSPIFFSTGIKVLRFLLDKGANPNTRDNCKRTPLMVLVQSGNARMYQLLVNRGADIHARDKYGATALHHAAWFNRCEEIRILLRSGADASTLDRSGRSPSDIASFWRCYDAADLLKEHDTRKLQMVEDRDDRLWLQLHTVQSMKILDYENISDLQKHLNIPKDKIKYINQVKNTPGIGSPGVDSEAILIEHIVLQIVKSIAKKVSELDKIFQCTVVRTGSTFEDTKICDPDEFDFVFVLDKFSSFFDPEYLDVTQHYGSGFAKLISNGKKKQECQRYIDVNDNLICGRVRHMFLSLVQRVLMSKDLWIMDEVYFNDKSLKNPVGKPVVSFTIFVTGALYKYLPVNIDIVPAIQKPGWWSKDTNVVGNAFVSDKTLAEGCMLLCQSPTDRDELTSLFRVSTLPAELGLLRTLPSWIKQSYIVAKMMKGSFLCPKLEFPEESDVTNGITPSFYTNTKVPEDTISSYILKNSLFHILAQNPHLISSKPEHFDRSALQLSLKIYEYLEHQTSKDHYKCFFLPCQNLFSDTLDTFCDAQNSIDNTSIRMEIRAFCQMIIRLYS